jgi:hypothetical protein
LSIDFKRHSGLLPVAGSILNLICRQLVKVLSSPSESPVALTILKTSWMILSLSWNEGSLLNLIEANHTIAKIDVYSF